MRVSGESFIIVNTLLTAFSMALAARVARKKTTLRLPFAALLSSLYALIALSSPFPLWRSVPFSLMVMYLSALIAFNSGNTLERFRLAAFSLASAILLSGLTNFLVGSGMNPLLAASVSAVAVMLGFILLRSPAPSHHVCTHLEVGFQKSLLRVDAMIDSGNLLTDPLTNLPVIVCSRRALEPLLPFLAYGDELHIPYGFRPISIRTAAGRGLLLCFTPEKLRVEVDGVWRDARGVIAVAPEAYDGTQALIPQAIFEGDM